MLPDSDAVRLDAFNSTTDVLRVRTGGNTQFASPTLYPNSFATRGTSIVQQVALFKAPNAAAGENVDFKLYYTNRNRTDGIRQFMGQCRMNNFVVGALTNCEFPLPTLGGVNAGNLEDPFILEVEVNTAATYKARVALGPISFGGFTFATPANKLAPTCLPPDPFAGRGIIDIVNPLRGILNVGLDPRPVYTLPNGQLLDIPLERPVIREIR
ncbi:MAG: hypothetical protein QM756_01845 [Polyangiaceae bacterium]